jgi:uncharacterized protein (TIGR00251 family)
MTQLAIKLQPGASADRIDGWDTDPSGRAVLKVRVRARPIEGQANEALVKFLAKALDLPKSAVTLARGSQSRLKMVEIAGLDDAALRARLGVALS